MTPDIPQNIVIAGLVGCLIALVVATAQQQWRWRVFFLLALRLAIGWQFMSEGLNKIQSHTTGVVGTGKPFSSEIYFREAEGPLGGVMRSMYLDDPDAELYDLTRAEGHPKTVGDVLGAEGLAVVEADLAKRSAALEVARIYAPPQTGPGGATDYYAKAVAALPLDGNGAKFLVAYPPTLEGVDAIADRVVAQVPPLVASRLEETARQARELAKTDTDKKAVDEQLFSAKRTFARWVLGLDAEPGKKKYVAGDIVQTVPNRLHDYEHRKQELEQLKARRHIDLGRSTLFARISETKSDMTGVRQALISEANGMIAEAKTELAKVGGVKLPDEPKPTKKIETLDILTMWTLTIAGACLSFGLGTRIAAIVCGGFLLMTYLTYPPLPWLPNPPGTEGNPVFINKNAIEMLACFALACLPTGVWMGIDALIYKIVSGDRAKAVVV